MKTWELIVNLPASEFRPASSASFKWGVALLDERGHWQVLGFFRTQTKAAAFARSTGRLHYLICRLYAKSDAR